METETDTNSTDIAIVPGRTPSERLLMDINEETVYQNKYVDRYKGDKQQQFIELRARGASYQDIADMLHCGKSTLVGWNKELADEIAERKAMTKNDILYDYQVARDNRLRYFAELYRKLKNEIERRGLRDVPTDKLYAMFEKCSKHIDELSGEKREDRKDASIIAISQTERVRTALKCVRTA